MDERMLSDKDANYELRIQHARVLPDPQKVCSWEWVRHQVYTINWSNVALLLAVLIVSNSIQGTLDSQRAANLESAQQVLDLQKSIGSAQPAIDILTKGDALINKFGNLTVVLELLDNISTNLTRLSSPSSLRAQYTPSSTNQQLVMLTSIQQAGTALEISQSGWSMIIREPGTYLIGCQTAQTSSAAGQDTWVVANTSSFDIRTESSWNTICSNDAATAGRATRVSALGLGIPNSEVLATSVSMTSFQQVPVYIQLCGDQALLDEAVGRRHELWAFKLG